MGIYIFLINSYPTLNKYEDTICIKMNQKYYLLYY